MANKPIITGWVCRNDGQEVVEKMRRMKGMENWFCGLGRESFSL